jgi:hypothetical protein
MKPLAICAVFKNEAPFLLEWIAFHRIIGFDHFVLYDNASTDGGADLVHASWASELVTVIPWPQRPCQLPAYRHFIYNFAEFFEWAAFIDLDEFLHPLRDTSIVAMLQSWSNFSAVLVNWHCFGPSGWMERPDGLVIDNYTWRSADHFPPNHHIKSIVKCADVLDVTQNPHDFQLKGPVCNTQGQPITNTAIVRVACYQNLVINHYVTRSHHDWMDKIQRGSAMFDNNKLAYEKKMFDHWVEVSDVRDDAITRFSPIVRKLLDTPAIFSCGNKSDTLGTAKAIMRRGRLPLDLAPPIRPIMVVHIKDVGDVTEEIGDWIGKRQGGRWIEGFSITPSGDISPDEIEYKIVMERDSLSHWVRGGTFSGTRGFSLAVRGFALRLRGHAGNKYHCTYSGTFLDGSMVTITNSGQPCVAPTLAPLEAMRVLLRARSPSIDIGSVGARAGE